MQDLVDIQLAGAVTWRNHTRLGYERLTRGVYGRLPDLSGAPEHAARRTRFLAHVHAAMKPYEGQQVVLHGPTAFQVMRVALPQSLEDWDRCHVVVPAGASRPNRHGVVAHHTTAPLDVWATRDGLPLLHPVDHWLQMRGTDDELIEVADGLVRRRRPLITMDDFHRRLAELRGVAGAPGGRRLVKWVMPGTDSLYETRTRLILVRAGLPTPAVNLPVASRTGFVYHVDLGYEREKVAIEYDGAVHVGDTQQMQIDAERRRDLQDVGWLIIPATAKQIADPVPFVRSVEEALLLRRAALKGRR